MLEIKNVAPLKTLVENVKFVPFIELVKLYFENNKVYIRQTNDLNNIFVESIVTSDDIIVEHEKKVSFVIKYKLFSKLLKEAVDIKFKNDKVLIEHKNVIYEMLTMHDDLVAEKESIESKLEKEFDVCLKFTLNDNEREVLKKNKALLGKHFVDIVYVDDKLQFVAKDETDTIVSKLVIENVSVENIKKNQEVNCRYYGDMFGITLDANEYYLLKLKNDDIYILHAVNKPREDTITHLLIAPILNDI